jgi:hypothetical protein
MKRHDEWAQLGVACGHSQLLVAEKPGNAKISDFRGRPWDGDSMKIKIDDQSGNTRGWLISVLTDIHFWVPVVVLIGGLLLLRWIH